MRDVHPTTVKKTTIIRIDPACLIDPCTPVKRGSKKVQRKDLEACIVGKSLPYGNSRARLTKEFTFV
jgi:hypothetical protein